VLVDVEPHRPSNVHNSGRESAVRRRCASIDAVPAHWLKALGHAGWSLPDAWLEDGHADRMTRTGFPRRPRIEAGDRLVYYASGWRCVFALLEVTGDPDDEHPVSARWPWTVPVEPLVVVPRLRNAPPVEAIGVAARSMSQQSHIRLRPSTTPGPSRRSAPQPSDPKVGNP
jgi:hypothetical protein